MFTCKHSGVQPLYPVGPDVETAERLQAIEGPDPDLGEEVVGEVQVPEGGEAGELVPAEAPEGVPESNIRRGVLARVSGQYLEKLMLASCW